MSRHEWKNSAYNHDFSASHSSFSFVWALEQMADRETESAPTSSGLEETSESENSLVYNALYSPQTSLSSPVLSPLTSLLEPMVDSTQSSSFDYLFLPRQDSVTHNIQPTTSLQSRNNSVSEQELLTIAATPNLANVGNCVADSPESSRGLSRSARIEASLNILRDGRINPVDFLAELIDVTNPKSAHTRGKLYSEKDKRLDRLLDKIILDPKGEAKVGDWFRRHALRKSNTPTLDVVEKENHSPRKGETSRLYRPY
ncbi:hypothetical protein D9757_003858 [Collybiopsis confluens]|uniref:Uncharacterized protein n=1 Tax=Collybiopsis confluens TaxID=2823264 RepID=A0A8H5HV55_9AGAR|nr:hypothetical protein D9757_003858 [Collybiopsis confluens]